MPSTRSDGTAPSSCASVSFHSSNTRSAVSRSPSNARDSILARTASSLSGSSTIIRSASRSIVRVSAVRRQRSIRTIIALRMDRQQPSLLALLPPQELVRVGDVEPVEKGRHLELGTGLVRQDGSGLESREVHRDRAVRESDRVPSGLQCLASELGPEHRNRGRQRVPAFGGGRPGPEEVGEVVAPMRRALLHAEIHQERDVLLHPKANGIAVRGEQGRSGRVCGERAGRPWYLVLVPAYGTARLSTDRQTCDETATSARRGARPFGTKQERPPGRGPDGRPCCRTLDY